MDRLEESAIERLRILTGKKHAIITQRGNKSILYALKIAKNLGKNKVVIQDQGGWITYLQYPKKLKMELIKIPTDHGMIDPKIISKYVDKNSVLLVNSLTGYFAQQPMKEIMEECKKKDTLVINDASGSIGTDDAKYGDIIICSFGEEKPIEVGAGGLLAIDDDLLLEKDMIFSLSDEQTNKLDYEIKNLQKRREYFLTTSDKIKNDLASYDIIHKDKKGINVIVAYKSEQEKEKILNYCRLNGYEFTECPRYIRVNADAISIEVKRL